MKGQTSLQQRANGLVIVILLVGMALLGACSDSTTATLVPANTTAPAATSPANTTVAATTAPAATTIAPSATSTPVPVATIPASTTAPARTTIAAATGATATAIPTTALPQSDVTPPPLGTAENTLKATGFSGDEARKFLDELTGQIGTRVVGSDGEKKAADWLEKTYRSFGYTQVSRQNFPINTREVRSGMLYTGSQPDRAKIIAFGVLLSKPQSKQLNGELTLYEDGGNLSGKIVAVTSGGSYAQIKPKVDAALSAGATGIVIIIPAGTPDYKTFADTDAPVIGISANQLQAVQNLAKSVQGKDVTLGAFYQPGSGATGQNVIAIRPGPKSDSPVLIFGGHYDSVATTVGASDNGSGTVVTLELAKVLFTKFPNYELRFINFSGEEIGIVGSSYYASRLSNDEKKRISVYINIDAVGVGDRFVAIGTPELVNLAVDVATQSGVRLESFNLEGTGAGSDHEAFMANGVKSVFLARWIDPQLHRPGDTNNRVYPEALLLGGGIAILVAQKVAGS